MIVYSLLILTLILAFASIYLLWLCRKRPLKNVWHLLLPAMGMAAFTYLYGVWVFVTVYAKLVFPVVFLLVLVVMLLSKKENDQRVTSRGSFVISLFFSGIFLLLSVLYFTGTTGKPYGVAHLALPFKSGTYFVFQGGKGLPTNLFHYGLRTAIYAIDIVKLNDRGQRAQRIFSTRLEDYEIFNDTVYSPCSGRVLKARKENPDNIPPNRKRGPSNTNQVLIETDSSYVFLAHFRQGYVFVRDGDTVTTGQALGLAGNSGFSLEPHLHIQVQAKTSRPVQWYQQPPLLIEFDGRGYLLFEEIKAGPKR